jgi:hypothetical protein
MLKGRNRTKGGGEGGGKKSDAYEVLLTKVSIEINFQKQR